MVTLWQILHEVIDERFFDGQDPYTVRELCTREELERPIREASIEANIPGSRSIPFGKEERQRGAFGLIQAYKEWPGMISLLVIPEAPLRGDVGYQFRKRGTKEDVVMIARLIQAYKIPCSITDIASKRSSHIFKKPD